RRRRRPIPLPYPPTPPTHPLPPPPLSLHASAHCRQLHSFPTRRSSDLDTNKENIFSFHVNFPPNNNKIDDSFLYLSTSFFKRTGGRGLHASSKDAFNKYVFFYYSAFITRFQIKLHYYFKLKRTIMSIDR